MIHLVVALAVLPVSGGILPHLREDVAVLGEAVLKERICGVSLLLRNPPPKN